jgi:AraC-like DNA-binding protein
MVRESMTAAAARDAVGHESTSRFNRDFKRLFGRTPAAGARRMKAETAVPPALADAAYMSSR